MFKKAERKRAKLRLALMGPSGSGKTYSALLMAKGMGGRVAVIDTEHGSASLYAHLMDYDVCEVQAPFTPAKYCQAIREAEKAGYDIIIIDSLTHAWAGQGGLLEEVDKRKGKGNDFTAWRDITPQHNGLVDAMLQSKCHVIATVRSKTAYEVVKDERTGKAKPMKVGMAPVQRDGLEYEFTVVLDLDVDRHLATASKDRTGLFDGMVFTPSEDTGREILAWLDAGVDEMAVFRADADKAIAEIGELITITAMNAWNQRNAARMRSLPEHIMHEVGKAFHERKAVLEHAQAPAPVFEDMPQEEEVANA